MDHNPCKDVLDRLVRHARHATRASCADGTAERECRVNIDLLVSVGYVLALCASTSLVIVFMRWRRRSYSQTIQREKPIRYYRIGQDVDYDKLKFPIGRSGVRENDNL
jgi:hypothetical protein